MIGCGLLQSGIIRHNKLRSIEVIIFNISERRFKTK